MRPGFKIQASKSTCDLQKCLLEGVDLVKRHHEVYKKVMMAKIHVCTITCTVANTFMIFQLNLHSSSQYIYLVKSESDRGRNTHKIYSNSANVAIRVSVILQGEKNRVMSRIHH